MKACNVKKADTFLVTRIPSWKLFSRLEHLCISVQLWERFLSRHYSHFVEGFGIIYLAKRNDESRFTWASPLPRAATQTWPERYNSSFQTVNSLPNSTWINARYSRPSKAHAKRLIQAYTFPKNRITEEVPGTPPFQSMQAKLKVME